MSHVLMTRRLTYANIVSSLALLVALCGGGVALASTLPKNSVASKQIKNGAIKSKDVADNTLTGTDVNESALGTVPSATKADRADRAAQVDTVQHVWRHLADGQSPIDVAQSGPFHLQLRCGPHVGPSSVSELMLTSSAEGLYVSSTGGADSAQLPTGPSHGVAYVMGTGDGSVKRFELSIVAENQFLEVMGQIYEFNHECGVNLVVFG